ncbi:MAG: hypothetical protein H0T47_19550 [Planctomycetaceae bacterium]|nr:hypothetical protein [Planctomycetaceae bacterium]
MITGRVVDKETKKPIDSFQVVPGIRSSETHMNWVENGAVDGRDGDYRVRRTHDYFAHLIRVEANGYAAATSRDIKSGEGNVTVDFELERAPDVAAVVLTADGKPAAGAKVALGMAGSQISVKNGDIDDGSTYAARMDTDDAGRFRFPSKGGPFQVVVTHPAGYAHFDSATGPTPEMMRLTPWARVEGTFRVGEEPALGVSITLDTNTLHSYGEDVPSIFTHHDVTTGADGRFAFERVVPGGGRIGRRITFMVNEGATEVTSAASIPAAFPAGLTTRIDLGGDGRPVTGRLEPPAVAEFRWSHAVVRLNREVGRLTEPAGIAGDAAKRAAWRADWLKSDAGRAWLTANAALQRFDESSPSFTATVDRDGTFRIDDVPPGEYVLTARIDDRARGGSAKRRVSVPDDGSREPLDLGLLAFEEP